MAKISAEEKKLTRQKILNASRTVFRQNGYEQTQVREIAELAGIGVSTLYGYYPSKIDLFLSSFLLDAENEVRANDAQIMEALQGGLTDALIKLLVVARFKDVIEDREMLKSFYIASVSDLAKNKRFSRVMRDDCTKFEYVSYILEIYERTNRRLCAFSLKALTESIWTIIQHNGTDYLLFSELSYEETAVRIRDQLNVLFAGKYEVY